MFNLCNHKPFLNHCIIRNKSFINRRRRFSPPPPPRGEIKNRQKYDVVTFKELGLRVADPQGKSVALKDLCFGDAILIPPFLKTIPRNYFYKIHKLFGNVLRKNHAYGIVYSRVTKRDSWLRNYILSKRIKYGSRSVISPSPDYRNVLRVWIPRAVASNRNLRDGDVVLIHRFPTLTAEHFVYARARVWDELTVGVAVGVLPALRSDCDGDVGDVLCVNGPAEKAEAEILMNPEHSFLAPSSNRNVLYFTQHMCYVFRLQENLALLLDSWPVFFRCGSFSFEGGKEVKVTGRVTRSQLNEFLRHVYYQLGAKRAVEFFNTVSQLTHTRLRDAIRGVTLADILELCGVDGQKENDVKIDDGERENKSDDKKEDKSDGKKENKNDNKKDEGKREPLLNENNLFLVQCRNEIKGSEEKIKKHMLGVTPNNYFCGIPADHQYHNAKIGRAGLVDSITLISGSGYDFKKIIFSLHDLVISYRGDVTIGGKESSSSLVYDLEFLFEYVHLCTGMKNSLLYALKFYRDTSV